MKPNMDVIEKLMSRIKQAHEDRYYGPQDAFRDLYVAEEQIPSLLEERAAMLNDIKRLRGALETCSIEEKWFDEDLVNEAISLTQRYEDER